MPTRRILRLRGADVTDFLQGLVTNDVAGLDTGLVYAALLTPTASMCQGGSATIHKADLPQNF